MRSGGEYRPYNKIVSPFRPCGFCLRQVVHRLTDPPPRIQRAGGTDGKAAVAELNTGGWNGEGDVETVVDEESDGLTVGQSDGEIVMLAAAQFPATRMKGQL